MGINSSNYGWIFGLIVIAALGIGLWSLWTYGWRLVWPSIKHWLIKSNSDLVSAVILETKKIGSEIQVSSGGTRYSHTNTEIYQPVRVKLEIHPNNGAPYIAYDKFNAHWYPTSANQLKEPLTPGSKLQVAVSRFNPQWVVALLETLPPPYEQRNIERERSMQSMPKDSIVSINEANPTNDPKAELGKLKEMLNSGLITQQDYEKKKSELLSRM
jgi:hypothetical protein